MLPPSQIQINATLTDDDVLIYKTAGSENGRVVISKFILWISRMIFNSLGLSYVLKNYMIHRSWSYFREMVQTLNDIRHVDNNFRISLSILNPKYVFIFCKKSNKMNSQNNNPYLFDTFKLNDDDSCHLQCARLSVSNGIYYPEMNIVMIILLEYLRLSIRLINKMIQILNHY